MRVARLLALLAAVAVVPSPARCASGDAVADRVLGQPGFTTSDAPAPPTASSLFWPQGIAIAPDSGRLYVADGRNNRVLSWPSAAAFTNGAAADLVLGQTSFASAIPNDGGIGAATLAAPVGVAVDGDGNVYVADKDNHRVLEYDAPPTHDAIADRVFGQSGSFTSATINLGGRSAASLAMPFGVAVDADGNLYVVDRDNNRVLEYDRPLATDTTADRVFGQPDFASGDAPVSPGPATLDTPFGVAVDRAGNVYVTDGFANRVLEYDRPLATDTVADRVLGQPDLTSGASGVGPSAFDEPVGIAIDPAGNVYVSDLVNNRVVGFVMPFDTDGVADVVFGQPDFQTATAPGAVGPTTLGSPTFLAVDGAGTLYVSDFDASRVLAFDTPLGGQPPLVTQVTATPNPAGVGQLVTFGVASARPGGGPLAVDWSFGDGATGAGAATSHAYAAAGTFTAVATVTDGAASTSAQVAVQVNAPIVGVGPDSDGDGFSDAFEAAYGTSPRDAGSAPVVGRPTPRTLAIGTLRIALDFAQPGNDRVTLVGTLAAPGRLALSGARLGVDVGGVTRVFTLDASGKGRASGDVVSVSARKRRAKLRLAVSGGSFATDLAADGLTASVKKARVQIPVSVVLDGAVWQKTAAQTFRVKQGRLGRTR